MKAKAKKRAPPRLACWYVEAGSNPILYGPWASAQAAAHWADQSLGCPYKLGKLRSPS